MGWAVGASRSLVVDAETRKPKVMHAYIQSAGRRVLLEVRTATVPIVERWRTTGIRGFTVSAASVGLVVLLWLGRTHSGTRSIVDWLSAVRLSQPVVLVIAKTPLSLIAPAYGLVLAGAVAQVLMVMVPAEVHLGRRRTLVVALGTQLLVNIASAQIVGAGHASVLGISAQHLSDRDTGPSVAVIAVALATAIVAGTYGLASITALGVAVATVIQPDRAAHEHVVGIALGVGLGAWYRVHDERREPVGDHERLFVRRRRTRRFASFAVSLVGVIAVASAATKPMSQRLRVVIDVVSLSTAKTANGLVAASGIGLLILALGLGRGHRRAWLLSIVLLVVAATGHVLKGGDLEEALLSVGAAAYLVVRRDAFRASARGSTGHVVRSVVIGLFATFVGGFVIVEGVGAKNHRRVTAAEAARIVVGDMRDRSVGVGSSRSAEFLQAALFGLGAAIVATGLWRMLRPAMLQRSGDERRRAQARARKIVREYGGGTLDYFSLRDDKQHFFDGGSVVSFAVRRTVCLVSPDPVGPRSERRSVWAAFRRFADDQGWSVVVVGAGRDWLDLYESEGMVSLYVGDEAIVDVATFDLAGGHRKGLRQAVNRVARSGYRVTFHDPIDISPAVRSELVELMAKGRRGGLERGFSMTLGRIFDDHDTGLLLALCSGSDGRPAAFCQFVPSAGVNGWSLDLMRRDLGDHPNGLLDFVLVETIRELARRGQTSLGLNFAAMRSTLAGETGSGLWQRVQRWGLMHLSGEMQIASLWKFNAKYGPIWQPRYVVLDGVEHTVTAAIAMASAEGLWELPVIGRWLRPKGPA